MVRGGRDGGPWSGLLAKRGRCLVQYEPTVGCEGSGVWRCPTLGVGAVRCKGRRVSGGLCRRVEPEYERKGKDSVCRGAGEGRLRGK